MGVPLRTESEVVNEWIDMHRLDEAKLILRRQIKYRFPEALTPGVERAIEDQPDHDLLMSWLDAVARENTAEGFLAVLRR